MAMQPLQQRTLNLEAVYRHEPGLFYSHTVPYLKFADILSLGATSTFFRSFIFTSKQAFKHVFKTSGELNFNNGLITQKHTLIHFSKQALRLRRLNLGYCKDILSDTILKRFIDNNGPYLRKIDLTNCSRLHPTSLRYLADNCPNLRSIYLRGVRRCTTVEVSYIVEHCHLLEYIDLTYLDISSDTIDRLAINCPNLKVLSLRGPFEWNETDLEPLGDHHTNLVMVDFSFRNANFNSLMRLFLSNPTLSGVSFRGVTISVTDAALLVIASLSLHYLDFTPLSPIGINLNNNIFTQLVPAINNLTELILADHNMLGRGAIEAIGNNCSALVRLNVRGCFRLVPDDLRYLLPRLPRLKILQLFPVHRRDWSIIHELREAEIRCDVLPFVEPPQNRTPRDLGYPSRLHLVSNIC